MVARGQVWPRYGTMPGYDQPDDGQEEIFTGSMMAALEWGLFKYAREVLDNSAINLHSIAVGDPCTDNAAQRQSMAGLLTQGVPAPTGPLGTPLRR